MATDRTGLTMAGTAAAVDAYDRALDGLLRFVPSTLEHLADGRQADPTCSMLVVMDAYVALGSTDGRAVSDVLDDLGAGDADAVHLTDRERRHRRAARAWAEGRVREASEILEGILLDHPLDLLALSIGHQLDFLLGDADGLRRRPARTLAHLTSDDDRIGFVHGMLAFGLEESGTHDQALRHAEQALDRSRDDAWAIHAAAHVFEMRGDVRGGLAHLDDRRRDWQTDSWMRNHTAWHRCLFLLAEGRMDDVLAWYDDELRHDGPEELPMPLCDAASLLWRLELAGGDVADRWIGLAEAWSGSLDPGYYPFNDVHAAMALARGGGSGAGSRLLEALEVARRPDEDDEVREVGLHLVAGMLAFAAREDAVAIEHLTAAHGRDHLIGGSLAQRDLIMLTVAAAAERSGRMAMARSLAAARLTLQPTNPMVRRTAERLGLGAR